MPESSSKSPVPSSPVSFVTKDPTAYIPNLQDALDNAVAAEQYSNAASIRDELRAATSQDSVQILSALLNYYEAFTAKDLNRVRRQWHDKGDVVCQHPLTCAQVGYSEVIAGYKMLFRTLPQDLKLNVSDVRIAAYGDTAYVTCNEVPESEALSMAAAGTADGKAKWHGLVATNIFERVRDYNRQRDEYLLVHHVSSPIFLAPDGIGAA